MSEPDCTIPKLLTVDEVAAILGIKPKTLRNKLLRRDGSAPRPIKTANGYNIRFSPVDVQEWLANNREGKN